MATKSFRIFATKEDLFSIFFDFQQNVKIHYFKCGRMYDLVEISDITKDTLFGINQKGNLLNSQWLVCCNDTMPLKRKNNMCLDNNIFFLDQEVNEYSAVINIGGVYEDKALFPTEISTIWYEKTESKELYTMLKKSCKKYTACTQHGYLIGKNALLCKEKYRFCTISIDSPQIYDLELK